MILSLAMLKQQFNLADYPVQITAVNGVATITLVNHNWKTGDYLNVTETTSFNGMQLVTRTGPNTLTFKSNAVANESGVIKQNDVLLTQIINNVENYINSYCNMKFGQETEASEILDLDLDAIVYPTRGLLADGDVTSILLSRENNFTDSSKFITLNESDFFLYDDRIELKFDKAIPYVNCIRAVKITYKTQAVPAEIQAAALQMVEFHFRIANDKSMHEQSRSINGEQRNFLLDIPAYIIEELDKRKRYKIGKPF